MASLQLQAYEILKQKFGEKDASIVIDFIETKISFEMEANIKHVATKEDLSIIRSELSEMKAELTKTIYIIGLVQFLAIVGTIMGILSFMGRH